MRSPTPPADKKVGRPVNGVARRRTTATDPLTSRHPDAPSMQSRLEWTRYEPGETGRVTGDLRVSTPFSADHLDCDRRLSVWVPPSYDAGPDDYPVVWMHDGQNLFDEALSYDGEWGVDETMTRLADEGLEAVVVGVPNAGDDRASEYAPFVDPTATDDPVAEVTPLADAYCSLLVERLVPAVESAFRVRTDPAGRAVVGSSLGGLVSLYAFVEHRDVFGRVGAMSPAVCAPWGEMLDVVADAGHLGGRVYVDVGGDEYPERPERGAAFERGARDLVATLERVGYERGDDLRFVYEPDAVHHESAWRRRFPDAARFLLE
jgi:predicted alpha/beta superfamily hydrolase